jgi:hypothetical protein
MGNNYDPSVLAVHVHSGPSDWESWREALQLSPTTVRQNTTGSLFVSGMFVGAQIELTGYGAVPALAVTP